MDDSRSAMETEEFRRLVSEQQKNSVISGEIAVTSKQTAKLDKMTVAIIVTLILGIIFFIVSQIINIEMKYKTLIRGIDRNKPSNWPTSGFFTALAVEYPGLASIHCPNKNLPTAAYLCFNIPPFSTSTCFNDKTRQILFAMMRRSRETENLSAQDLICITWGNSSSVIRAEGCVNDCQSSTNVGDMISKGVGVGSLGFFAGGAIKDSASWAGPLGGVAGIGAGVAISYFQDKQRQDAQNKSANCGSSSSVSTRRVSSERVGDSDDTVSCGS